MRGLSRPHEGGVTEPLLREHRSRDASEDSFRRSPDEEAQSERSSLRSLMRRPRASVGQDRGTGWYQQERERLALPSLVEAGRHAGRSRVLYKGRGLGWTLLTRDFFITMINQKTRRLVALAFLLYLLSFWAWGLGYYTVLRLKPDCLYGVSTLVEAWVLAIVTQTTIGYGNSGPNHCWVASWMIAIQVVWGVLLNALVMGVVFARISHPKNRGRSIYVSEVATIARRDGILKFMFRVADVRKTQVVQPSVRAYLYTWGEGRVTAEGETIPVRCEHLDIGYIDGMLLLPLIIEHTIDERSPLCGHTHDSLMALNAEVVVTFEGTTEFGNPFMVRRSFLAPEMAWGHHFKEVIQRPFGDDTRYAINLDTFHEVVRQPDLPPLAPSELSKLVVNRAKRSVPYPLLGENTLVLSDVLCLAPDRQGRLLLTCRVADTYPNQMVELGVRMYVYRWKTAAQLEEEPEGNAFTQHQLEVGTGWGQELF